MILAIDIGATKTRLARLRDGKLVKSKKIRTQSDAVRFLKDLQKLIKEFLGPDRNSLEAIGIGAPGPLDLDTGVFGPLPNLPDWEGFDIGDALASSYRVPVRIQNDANAAALGEAIHGGGRGYRSVYYITISTGIGGGFILERRIVNGASHLTGEIWALPVRNFGKRDILLNSSSGPGIVRTARRLMDKGQPSSLSILESFDTEEVFQQAQLGDPLCRRVMENAASNMASAVVSILLIVDPEVVLIGGGLAFSDDCMINPIRRLLPKLAYLEEHRLAPIRKAELWNEAVLYGAVSLFED
jgi:glucokinase